MKWSRSATITAATSGALFGAAALHVAWGLGSDFPFRSSSSDAFVDKVVGSTRRPARRECFAVAVALGVAGAVVAVPTRNSVHRATLDLLAGAFGVRAALGLSGYTRVLGLGGRSRAFRSLDRYLYAPVCAAIATGIITTRRRAREAAR